MIDKNAIEKPEHFYQSMNVDEKEELFSNFLINSWSYSKTSSFARNEKAFEMRYIYLTKSKYSATTIAGSAYHEALEVYFKGFQDGAVVSLPELEKIAFTYIDEVHANVWKIQKTTPSIQECKLKATKVVTKLLSNFYKEKSLYEDDIKRVLGVELKLKEFITVNGVDIPLPCSGVIDLAIQTHDDRVVIIDHKSKTSFTDDAEAKLIIGRQAITYALLYEMATGIKVDEVRFVENKHSANRDKNKAQLESYAVILDGDTRKLYEALLYEPLKRMIEAVSDPDYVYLMNESDNFVDKAELHEFWCKTQIGEIGQFDIDESKKDMIEKRLKKVRDSNTTVIDPKIIKNFQENANSFIKYDLNNTNMTKKEKIEHVLRAFNIISEVAHTFDGYSSDTYLLQLSAGTKIQSVHARKLDIANALNVSNVRIMPDLFVYEGRSYVAIESSKKREKNLLWDASMLKDMKIPIGMDNFGRCIYWDLNNPSTPHVLLCGGTGSGKSVSIRSSIEYALAAGVDQIEIFDPKFEFLEYNGNSNVSVYNEIIDIEKRAKELVDLMNGMISRGEKKKILVIMDEFADAYMMSRTGKDLEIREDVKVGYYKTTKNNPFPQPKFQNKVTGKLKSLEENVQSLLQKGRSSGFRLILATQRADTKVINGNAKVNLPVQICFRGQKEVESKVVLDESGAETLAGNGDGLFRSPEYPGTVRFQAFFKK